MSTSPLPNAMFTSHDLPTGFDPQDPIWTAWLLDELGPDELGGTARAALDRIVAATPAAQAWVREMRSLTGDLKAGLACEPLPGLTTGQRDELAAASRGAATAHDQPLSEAALAQAVTIPRRDESAAGRAARWRMWGSSLALTAAVAAGIALIPLVVPSEQDASVTYHTEAIRAPSAPQSWHTVATGPSGQAAPKPWDESGSRKAAEADYVLGDHLQLAPATDGSAPVGDPQNLTLARTAGEMLGKPAESKLHASMPGVGAPSGGNLGGGGIGGGAGFGPGRATPLGLEKAPASGPASRSFAASPPPAAQPDSPAAPAAPARVGRPAVARNPQPHDSYADGLAYAPKQSGTADGKPNAASPRYRRLERAKDAPVVEEQLAEKAIPQNGTSANRGAEVALMMKKREDSGLVAAPADPRGESRQLATAEKSRDNAPARDRKVIADADAAGQPELGEVDKTEPLKQAEPRVEKLKELADELQVAEREAVQLPALQQVDALNELAERYDDLIRGRRDGNTEAYDQITDNTFQRALGETALSTFSIDVDTAAYTNLRRYLNGGSLPPRGAIRIEEMVNYFPYSDTAPTDGSPFSARIEIAECPWQPQHRLARVALKGREIAVDQRPVSNLVFLVDVSGSMQDENKLPLVREGLRMLVNQLGENDRVSIVVYAGASGLVLPSTSASNRQLILSAIDNLQAGGSTNGGAGIELAYKVATENFIKGGTNRVILCTDGDFNVGVTSRDELIRLVEEKAKANVFATILGFGMGNLKDSMLEQLADKGNGQYGYIDSLAEARKQFVDQLSGTLITIAKDVKIQLEFNPAKVAGYRLIGYENRVMANQDFRNDAKDAGEIGAGHSVTALYEIIPAGQQVPQAGEAQSLKYQVTTTVKPEAATSNEWLTLRLRHKAPEADKATEQEFTATDSGARFGEATIDFRWSAAVAAYGMVLRDSPYKGLSTLPMVKELAESAKGTDAAGYRAEFVELVRKTETLLPPK